MGFSFQGTDGTGTFNSSEVVKVPETQGTAEKTIHTGKADLFVWSRDTAGLKATKQGVKETFETADFSLPGDTIRLPVFSWSSTSYRHIFSMVIGKNDGSLSVVDCDPDSRVVVQRTVVPPYYLALGGQAPNYIVLNTEASTLYLTNGYGFSEIDAGTFRSVAAVSNGEGLKVCSVLPAGLGGGDVIPSGEPRPVGTVASEGRLFTTCLQEPQSSSSSPLED
jgi:hypothetical protein